jgi:hypothetical protein
VVSLDVEQHGDPRGEGLDVLELEARELADDQRAGLHLAVEGAEGEADVPGGGCAGDLREQGGRRRLPLGPGDSEDGVGEDAEAKLDVAPDRDRAGKGGGGERGLVRDAAALDDDVDARKQLKVFVVAEPPVGLDDVDPPAAKSRRRGRALPREAEDERSLRERVQRRCAMKSKK